MEGRRESRLLSARCELSRLPAGDQQRIGVWLPTWLGDACMATPFLRGLRVACPQATLVGVMRPIVSELFPTAAESDARWFDERVLFSKHRNGAVNTRFGLVPELRRRKLDMMFLLPNSFWTAAVSRLAGVPRVVGHARDRRTWLITDRPSAAGQHAAVSEGQPHSQVHRASLPPVDDYLALLAYFGIDVTDRRMTLSVADEDEVLLEQLWKQVGFLHSVPTYVINSNSATASGRVWPADRVLELARQLVAESNCQVLLHCGPGERELANSIAVQADHPRIASMGIVKHLPVGLTKAVLKTAEVVISSDSGPRHIAAAFNRPTIVLYGITRPQWNTTYNDNETAVVADDVHISSDQRMQAISVNTVMEAVRQLEPGRRQVA